MQKLFARFTNLIFASVILGFMSLSAGRIFSQAPAPTCTDSDGGNSQYTKGFISYTDSPQGILQENDVCDGLVVIERICTDPTDNTKNAVRVPCPYGCTDGRCLKSVLTPIPLLVDDLYIPGLTSPGVVFRLDMFELPENGHAPVALDNLIPGKSYEFKLQYSIQNVIKNQQMTGDVPVNIRINDKIYNTSLNYNLIAVHRDGAGSVFTGVMTAQIQNNVSYTINPDRTVRESNYSNNYYGYMFSLKPRINPLIWQTETAFLKATSMTITTPNGNYYGVPDVILHSNPVSNNNTYATLEAQWYENGTEMRVNIYFANDNGVWLVKELRTYNGDKTNGNWIYYDGFAGATVGQALESARLYLKSRDGSGSLTFENLNLNVNFLQSVRNDQYVVDTSLNSQPVKITTATNTGYGFNFFLKSQAGIVTDNSGIIFEPVVDRPDIIAINTWAPMNADGTCLYGIKNPCPENHIDVRGLNAGKAIITITAKRGGVTIGSTAVFVEVASAEQVSCAKADEAITTGAVKSCCDGTVLVPPTDQRTDISGICRKTCQTNNDCTGGMTCALQHSGVGICKTAGSEELSALRNQIQVLQKQLTNMSTIVNQQKVEQSRLSALISSVLQFLQRFFNFRR